MTVDGVVLCKCGGPARPGQRDCYDCHNAARMRYAKRTPYPVSLEALQRQRAREICRISINRGDLVRKPCEVCGNPDTEAHHKDYSKPLEATWLCVVHHLGTHGKRSHKR